MKLKILFILLYFSSLWWDEKGSEVCAQQTRFDSLIKANYEHSIQDEKKLQLLNKLSEGYLWVQVDSGIMYCDLAIKLALKLNKQNELAEAYNYLALYSYQMANMDMHKSLLESAVKIYTATGNKNGLAETYGNLAYQYSGEEMEGYFKKSLAFSEKTGNQIGIAKAYEHFGVYNIFIDGNVALKYLFKALEIFKKEKNYSLAAKCLATIGYNYYILSDLKNSFHYCELGLQLATETGNRFASSSCYSIIASNYESQADYANAMQNAMAGYRIDKKYGSKQNQLGMLLQLGTINTHIKNFPEAIKFFKTGMEQSINNKEFKIALKQGIGNAYLKTENFKEALFYFRDVLKMSTEIKNEFRLNEGYSNMAEVFEKLNEYDSSFIYFKKALELNKKMKNDYSEVQNLLAKSILLRKAPDNILFRYGYMPSDKNELIKTLLLKCITIASEKGERDIKRNALYELSLVYEEEKNLRQSLAVFKEYVSLKDSILNTDNSTNIALMQIQYETEKKEQQIALLNKDKALQQIEIEKQKTTRNSFMGGFTLVLMIGGVTFNRYRVKQKANKQLAFALEQLKDAQQQLIQQEKLASAGQLTAGIAHEIQNPLNFVINFSELSSDLVQEIEQATTANEKAALLTELEDNIHKIERHRNRANGIVQSMLQHSRNDVSPKQFENINEICADAVNLSVQTAHIKYPQLQIKFNTLYCSHSATVNAVKDEIVNVVLNILNNASYAVNEKKNAPGTNSNYQPEISLTTSANEKFVSIEITDNGMGIREEIKSKIFQPFFTTKPTNRGTGLGLSLSYDIIKAHGGEIIVESIPNESTTFTIKLPL